MVVVLNLSDQEAIDLASYCLEKEVSPTEFIRQLLADGLVR